MIKAKCDYCNEIKLGLKLMICNKPIILCEKCKEAFFSPLKLIEETKDLLARLYGKGLSIAEIAAKLGVVTSTKPKELSNTIYVPRSRSVINRLKKY